jgi:hypothetical protein
MQQGASLRPGDFAQGGGMIDDVDLTVKQARFVLWDYDGKVANPTLALKLDLEDDDGVVHEQYYSAGDPKHFVPSNDGTRAVPTGTKSALSGSSNMFLLIASLTDSGFPEDQLSDDVSVFDGLRGHFIRVPQPKRTGLPTQPGADTRDKTVLVMNKLIAMPGATVKGKKAAGKPNGQGGKAAAPAASAAATTDLDEKAQDVVMSVLADRDGSVAKKDIASAAFKAASDVDAKTKAQIAKLVYTDEFLNADGRPWSYDGTTISLG